MSNYRKGRTYTPGQFTDVNESMWYGSDNQRTVALAYEYGLMKGISDTTFSPNGEMKISEAIAVAARVHSIYSTGADNFTQGNPWYQVYVDYAVDNGLIASNDFTNYSKTATRAEMAYIFSRTLPETEFPEQNTVYSLPDVNSNTPYRGAILMLYKAGVLTGDSKGAFSPGENIKRAEAAAIISRVILPDTRKSGQTY